MIRSYVCAPIKQLKNGVSIMKSLSRRESFGARRVKHKMKIKKFIDDPSLTLEERYNRLQAHHLEETKELIEAIEKLEADVEETWDRAYWTYMPF
jgi:hypothetical protein